MRFLLNTDAVTGTANSVKSIATAISSIADTCNGFDTSCEDGFDFASAKAVIVSNITNCAERMNNCSTQMNGVVDAHTSLQQSYTYENFINPPEEKTDDANVQYYSGRSSGGGSRSSGGSRYGYATATGYAASSMAAPTLEGTINKITTEVTESTEKVVEEIGSQVKSKESQFQKLSYAKYDSKKLTDKSKEALKDMKLEEGYVKVNNMYTIACDPSIAKVGDKFKFTGKDGKTVEFIVGVNTVKEEYKGKMFLLVDNKDVKAVDFANMVTDKDTKVEYLGNNINKPALAGTVQEGLQKALDENKNVKLADTTTNDNAASSTTTTNNEAKLPDQTSSTTIVQTPGMTMTSVENEQKVTETVNNEEVA